MRRDERDMDRYFWTELIREAVRDPKTNGARIAAWPLPDRALAEALVLVSVLAILGVHVVLLLGAGVAGLAEFPSPFLLLAVQVVVMLLLAGVMVLAGRMFGGKGDFGGALRIMVWLQGLMVLLQAVQLVALVVLPPLAGLLSLVSAVLIGWLSAGLVAGLHRFRSIGLTFLGILGSMLVLGLVLGMLLAPFLGGAV